MLDDEFIIKIILDIIFVIGFGEVGRDNSMLL